MHDFEILGRVETWEVLWHPVTHKLYVRRPGFVFSDIHEFEVRPRSPTLAFDIVREWVRRRR